MAVKFLLRDGGIATFGGCSQRSGDGASLQLVELDQPGVSREAVRTLDFSRGHAAIEFNANAELLGGEGRLGCHGKPGIVRRFCLHGNKLVWLTRR